jgi:hypothetical protein
MAWESLPQKILILWKLHLAYGCHKVGRVRPDGAEGVPTALNVVDFVRHKKGKKMKKLFFVMVLVLAFAVPSMAGVTVPVGGTGVIGPYCTITGSAVTLDLGPQDLVGTAKTSANAVVSTNDDAEITVSIASTAGANTIVGTATGHSLASIAYWVPSGNATDPVTPPENGVVHPYEIAVTRGGVGDPDDTYTGTITLSIVCP